jgi:transposase-like protein
MSRDLAEFQVAALMVDGIQVAGRCCVVALAILADGTKLPVGLWDGSTENATVVRHLLADLQGRGLDASHGLLVVIDGAKALATAVRQVFGDLALIQRCTLHKRRNVADHLPRLSGPGLTPSWPGRSTTPTRRWVCAPLASWLAAWSGRTQARQPACARAWRRCSPSAASASTADWPTR